MGAVFSIFAGFYYWAPKMFGKMYEEHLAQAHFWTFFIGVNMTFIPSGMLGYVKKDICWKINKLQPAGIN